MIKKIFAIVLSFALLLLASSCQGIFSGSKSDYKIGIITGIAKQYPEEYNKAVSLKDKYGERIITAQYSDTHVLTVGTPSIVKAALNLAGQGVSAIVFAQAVKGTCDAVDAVKKKYPKVFIVCCVPEEDITLVANKADMVFIIDEIASAKQIIKQAKDRGAKTFINYSFQRHTDNSLFKARNDFFAKTCKELGIKYVYVNSVDPNTTFGVEGANRFITEDMAREVKKYGKNTAYFSSEGSAQATIIKNVLQYKAVFCQPCYPSPYTGFPEALGINVQGSWDGSGKLLEQIRTGIDNKGMSGRLSTWPEPTGALMLETGVNYAVEYSKGKNEGSFDFKSVESTIKKLAGKSNNCSVGIYKDEKAKELKNCYTILCDYYNF